MLLQLLFDSLSSDIIHLGSTYSLVVEVVGDTN